MSEKLEVRVTYQISEEIVKNHLLETGEYIDKFKIMNVEFYKFPKDVKELICEWYLVFKDGIRIDLKEDERIQYAKYENLNIEPFLDEIQNEEKMIQEVSWLVRMKEKHKNKQETKSYLKAIKRGDYVRIEYDTSIEFRKQELINEKKILGYKIEALINTMDIEDDVLAFIEELGYIQYNKQTEKMEICIYPSKFWEEGKYPLSSYLTKHNVNDFLRWYYEKTKEQNDKKEKENNNANSIKQEKEKWIEEYGSSYLQRACKLNYNCQRLYVEERAKQEFPNWTLDFDNKLSVKERPLPSEKALDIEEEMREMYPEIDIRVHWKKEGESGKEIIVIRNYLGKYNLFREAN